MVRTKKTIVNKSAADASTAKRNSHPNDTKCTLVSLSRKFRTSRSCADEVDEPCQLMIIVLRCLG